MIPNRVLRTGGLALLSALVALAACSFLALGSASAQTATTNATVTVQIIDNSLGQAVFSQSTLTITSGTQVTVVNHTAARQFVFNTLVFVRLAPGASASLALQISPERFKIYESPISSLLITISPGP